MKSFMDLYPIVSSILATSASFGPMWRSAKVSKGSNNDTGFLRLLKPLDAATNRRGRTAHTRPILQDTLKIDMRIEEPHAKARVSEDTKNDTT